MLREMNQSLDGFAMDEDVIRLVYVPAQGSGLAIVADRVGFEPTVGVNPRRFSRPLP